MKSLLIVIYIIIHICHIESTDQFIKLSLLKQYEGYLLELYMGKDKIKLHSKLDTLRNDSFISNRTYKESNNFPTIYISEQTYNHIDGKSYSYKIYKDAIQFENNISLQNFMFSTFRTIIPPITDSISISYLSQYNPNSLINLLYDNGYINKKVFFISNEDSLLYIGKTLSMKHLFKGECMISQEKWGCPLYSVKLNNKIINTGGYYAEIDSTERVIQFPVKLFNEFINKLFGGFIERGICSYNRFYSENRYICQCNIVDHISDLEIGLGYNLFYINKHRLFFEYERFCILVVESTDKNNVVLGTDFLFYYSVELDFELKKIALYGDGLLVKNNINVIVKWIALKIEICCLLFGLGLHFYEYVFKKYFI